jgi:hypothetical protein
VPDYPSVVLRSSSYFTSSSLVICTERSNPRIGHRSINRFHLAMMWKSSFSSV